MQIFDPFEDLWSQDGSLEFYIPGGEAYLAENRGEQWELYHFDRKKGPQWLCDVPRRADDTSLDIWGRYLLSQPRKSDPEQLVDWPGQLASWAARQEASC